SDRKYSSRGGGDRVPRGASPNAPRGLLRPDNRLVRRAKLALAPPATLPGEPRSPVGAEDSEALRRALPTRGRRPSLLTTFALVSLVPIALLGFGLSQYLEPQVRARAYA